MVKCSEKLPRTITASFQQQCVNMLFLLSQLYLLNYVTAALQSDSCEFNWSVKRVYTILRITLIHIDKCDISARWFGSLDFTRQKPIKLTLQFGLLLTWQPFYMAFYLGLPINITIAMTLNPLFVYICLKNLS